MLLLGAVFFRWRVYLAHLVNQRCSEMLCAAVWGVAFPSADHHRYAYDFLEVFQRALTHQWQEYAESLRRSIPIPQETFKAVELILESEAAAGGLSCTAWHAFVGRTRVVVVVVVVVVGILIVGYKPHIHE